MGVRLKRGGETVQAERDDAAADPDPPRCSRTPCQTSQAPPISSTAAATNSAMERAMSKAAS